MSKELSEMSLEELWQLFPIILVKHNEEWAEWYQEEQEILQNILQDIKLMRVSHIGSTTIDSICAKPIIDILIESENQSDWNTMKERLLSNGYLCMSADSARMSFNKGYTKNGFAKRVFHIHIRLAGDHDELYFRDYLKENGQTAKEYEKLKQELAKQFEHNRDAYTESKTDFIVKYTTLAKKMYRGRYEE